MKINSMFVYYVGFLAFALSVTGCNDGALPNSSTPSIRASSVDCKLQLDTSSSDRLANSLSGSQWTFESSVWSGDLHFETSSTYSTVWGKGHFTANNSGQIFLVNDYDLFKHTLTIDPISKTYKGMRSDSVEVSGQLNCGQLTDWDPNKLTIGNSPEEKAIQEMYQELLGRKPDAQGFKYWLNQYRKGVSLEDIRQQIMSTPEYFNRK